MNAHLMILAWADVTAMHVVEGEQEAVAAGQQCLQEEFERADERRLDATDV